MHIKKNELLSSTRWSISYIIMIPVIVCIFVVWIGNQRIKEFEQSHLQIAESTTTIVASELSKRIKNQKRLLRVFAKNEKKLIYRLSLSPEDENLKSLLERKVKESFPDYFAVSIADHSGSPIFDDFDSLVGELCLEDLKHHAMGKEKPIRIHPNTKKYHIDIIVPWSINTHKEDNKDTLLHDKKGGLLFVSFPPDFLYRLLAVSSPPRHELMLINREVKNLIEITEKGARIKLKRDDFRLNNKELQRQLFSVPVENTVWNLVDFREEKLFYEYKKNIISFSLIIHVLFISASIAMIVLLLKTEKIRIKAEETKQEMFSLFNHDLGAPLNSIFGFLEMYTETKICEKKPDRCEHFAKVAFDNAVIMREIINDILDLEKMEAGKMSFYFEEVELINLVKNSIDMSRQYGFMNKVKLDVQCEVTKLYIKADARRITQAITNLLSNAIKYSPDNETVVIKVQSCGNQAIISVADKGPGIEENFQPLVFNKFSQSKSHLTRRVGGTGLGLTIVKHIVDVHNGYVTLISSPDGGTTFKIGLPC